MSPAITDITSTVLMTFRSEGLMASTTDLKMWGFTHSITTAQVFQTVAMGGVGETIILNYI